MDDTVADLTNLIKQRKIYPIYNIKCNKYHTGNQIYNKSNWGTRNQNNLEARNHWQGRFLNEAHFQGETAKIGQTKLLEERYMQQWYLI